MAYQNYKKFVEDLVQVISSQEKELAEKSTLMATCRSRSRIVVFFCCFLVSFSTLMLADQYSAIISAMQMLPS
jgi:hypothetical protein